MAGVEQPLAAATSGAVLDRFVLAMRAATTMVVLAITLLLFISPPKSFVAKFN